MRNAFETSDAWTMSFNEFRNGMINQVDLARKVTLFSPFSAYSLGVETLAESGIVHYRRFFEQVENYRRTMRQALLDLYPRTLDAAGWEGADYEKSVQPIKPSDVPMFEERRVPIRTAAAEALPYGGLLAVFTVFFFSAAFVSFLKYDVR